VLEIDRTPPGPWSDEEIDLWGKRKRVFMTLDLNEDQAEDLAERLLYRDRDPTDDRRLCLACAYLIGSKCMNKHASVVKTFEPCKTVLWRCDYFWLKGTT